MGGYAPSSVRFDELEVGSKLLPPPVKFNGRSYFALRRTILRCGSMFDGVTR